MQSNERGFTLIEVLLGAAAGAALTFLLLVVAAQHVRSAALLNARLNAQSAAMHLSERMSAECAGAWAIFVPPADVLGRDNADGHEVDFFSEDGAHRAYAWAYRYDAAAKSITRYAYAPGIAAVAGEALGPFDSFHAQNAGAATISSPPSPIYDPLFANLAVPDVRYSFAAMPGAVGGNAMTRVSIAAAGARIDTTLASATAPTSFTIRVTYTPAPVNQTPTPSPLPTFTP